MELFHVEEDMDHLLKCAVLNNIDWCQTICETHNNFGTINEMLFGLDKHAPRFYPEVITKSTDTTLKNVKPFIDRGHVTSIKDSYAKLDLSHLGYMKFIEAEWIYTEG